MQATESRTTPGEDIGPITWPVIPAAAASDRGPHYVAQWERPTFGDAGVFSGRYEFCARGVAGQLDVARDGDGRVVASLELRLPSNSVSGRPVRILRLLGDVRATWLEETARGATCRRDAGERIAGAIAAIAVLPGQHTVSAVEDGVTVADGVAALREMLAGR